MRVWHDHFQDVFCIPEYEDPGRSDYLKDRVNDIRRQLYNQRTTDHTNFDGIDLMKICESLKEGKACGHDQISYEHIKYGGKLLLKHLRKLFELILQLGCVPNEWRKSVIIMLYKGGNKPRSDTNSYRGISLVPSIAKIFEKIVELELSRLRPDFPNPQQVAYQKGISSLNASFNLQEVTLHHVERNGTINVALLDSCKAFDTVSHDGLRLKLFEYGTTPKLWILLDNMYTGLNSAVLSNRQLSDWFNLQSGVRQGSVLSAKLYLIFINDLINQLEGCQQGAKLHDINVSSPVQADDISIITTNFHSMQHMVNICEQYSKDWSFNFSTTKSHLLQFGKKTTGHVIELYGEPISSTVTAKHVGITLTSSLKSTDRTIHVCRTLRATVSSIIRLGVHPSLLNPKICGKLVRQVCYPKAMYGCELWGKLSPTEILMLERTQRYICKSIQGLPRRTRSDMCLSLLGWLRIEAYINEKKLLLLERICSLPSNAVSFRILIRRIYDYKYNDGSHPDIGFVGDIYDILINKYDLVNYLDAFVQTSNFPTKSKWKRMVKTSIMNTEVNEWKIRMNNESDITAFRNIHKSYEPHPALIIASKYPNLKKHAHYLISVCCLIHDITDANCLLCDRCGKTFCDPIVHAVTSCDFADDVRDEFWCEIIDINPIDFSVFLANKNEEELCYYLLSCCSDQFDLEPCELETFQLICLRYIHRFGTLLQC